MSSQVIIIIFQIHLFFNDLRIHFTKLQRNCILHIKNHKKYKIILYFIYHLEFKIKKL